MDRRPLGGAGATGQAGVSVPLLASSSSEPFLNSDWALPSERASWGSLAPPKIRRMISRMIRSSGAPRFTGRV